MYIYTTYMFVSVLKNIFKFFMKSLINGIIFTVGPKRTLSKHPLKPRSHVCPIPWRWSSILPNNRSSGLPRVTIAVDTRRWHYCYATQNNHRHMALHQSLWSCSLYLFHGKGTLECVGGVFLLGLDYRIFERWEHNLQWHLQTRTHFI